MYNINETIYKSGYEFENSYPDLYGTNIRKFMGETMEIEKKYQIKELPSNINQYQRIEIEQAYLSLVDPILRVRKSNDDYMLTYKSCRGFKKDNPSISCDSSVALIAKEVELPLSKEAYEHLIKKADYNIIFKTRYLIPLENELLAELDVFHEKLNGLMFVEVEFPDETSAKNFIAPKWFGKDVTFDFRYRNFNLSKLNDMDQFAF